MLERLVEQPQSRSGEEMDELDRLDQERCQKENLLAEIVSKLDILSAMPEQNNKEKELINECRAKISLLQEEIKAIKERMRNFGANWV